MPRRSTPPSTRRPPEPLTPDETIRIIRACSRRAPTGVRNAALFSLLYSGGLRLGEALALRPSDVDLDRCTVHVRHGKGDKDRLVGIHPEACTYVQRWFDARRRLGLARRQHLFCTLKGAAVDPRYVRFALNRAAARAGVDKRVHPHGLRHTHAVGLVEQGVPVHEIRDQLGHASLATTDVYLRRIAPKDRLKRISKVAWAAADSPAADPLDAKIAALTEQIDALRREAAARQEASA
jgi:site-specific recombinase XerD